MSEDKANMSSSSITDKEVLDLAWKYFQQHAQQRISLFNFFVVFSVLITSGLITTFQEKFRLPITGVGLGIFQVIISYFFWKLDERNKFLTKHGENVIKELESNFNFETQCDMDNLRLFTSEKRKTDKICEEQKGKLCLCKQWSHSCTYSCIYIIFALMGILGSFASGWSIHQNTLKINGDGINSYCYESLGIRFVASNYINVHETPRIDADITSILPFGKVVRVQTVQEDWVRVEWRNKDEVPRIGWVKSNGLGELKN